MNAILSTTSKTAVGGNASVGQVARATPDSVIWSNPTLPYDQMIVQDQKTSGTSGGTSLAVTDHVRILNTIVSNTITGGTLNANQVSLPAGGYLVDAYSANNIARNTRIFIYNVTAGSTSIVGQSVHSRSPIVSFIDREILKLDIASIIELRQYIETGLATTGLGVPVTSGRVEIYSQIIFRKLG